MSESYGMWIYLNQAVMLKKKKKWNVSPSLSEISQRWIIGIRMNKSFCYNIDNICTLKGARLRKGSFNLGETDHVYSKVLWNPRCLEPAHAPLVPLWKNKCMFAHSLAHIPQCSALPVKIIGLVRFDSFILCSPPSANTMWEKHFQLEETNCECCKKRATSPIWPLF